MTAIMKGNRKRDTKPEVALRSALHRSGLRFRKHYGLRPDAGRLVRVDIVFPSPRVAVFVDGCFWHRCPAHGTSPRSNSQYWQPKLQRNVDRDRATDQRLRTAGWTVLRIWEHEVADPAACCAAVARIADAVYVGRGRPASRAERGDVVTEPVVLYEVADHVATITINRPERYNSLNYEAYELLTHRFEAANADDDVRAIIFTGRGRGFCTGDDVIELLGAGAAELSRRIATGELELPSAPMKRSDKPIIAAVNGAAVGYGMELSLLADIRIAAESARFSEMFVKRAIVAGPDSFELLPQLVGTAAAAEILLTGDLIDAQRAHEIGLVSQVVADADLPAAARALAARMTVNAPLAVQAAKRAITYARTGQREELQRYLGPRLSELLASADHQESVAAFLEKRDPTYHGR